MSLTVEWADAAYLTGNTTFLDPGQVEDSYSQTNDRPALVLDNGCSHAYVIEGTVAELRSMLTAALAALPEETP